MAIQLHLGPECTWVIDNCQIVPCHSSVQSDVSIWLQIPGWFEEFSRFHSFEILLQTVHNKFHWSV